MPKRSAKKPRTPKVQEESDEEDSCIPIDVLVELPTKEKELVPKMKVPVVDNGDVDFPALVA